MTKRTQTGPTLLMVGFILFALAAIDSNVSLVSGQYAQAARQALVMDSCAIVLLAICLWRGPIWIRVVSGILMLPAFGVLVDCVRRGHL